MDAVNSKTEDLAILFIPETGIYPFARGLSVLGDAIAKTGGHVMMTHCTGQMIRCPMMVMHKLPIEASPEEKAALCRICSERFMSAQKKYNFSSINLSEFVNDDLLNSINELTDNTSDELINITYDEFPVGEIAQYDFVLETKYPYYSMLSDEHRKLYALYVKNTALTIAVANAIFEKYNPNLVLTFNEYAQCQGVRHSAVTHNVARMALTHPVHFNIDFSRFSIWNSTYEVWRYTHCQRWYTVKDIPIQARYVLECWKDTIYRMYSTGSHIFSVQKVNDPVLIFNKLKLNPYRKRIVVYTSSQDERGTGQVAVKVWKEDTNILDAFSNQIEWLSFLRNYASKHTDVQIVVRIHPREGNRQYGFSSKHLEQLRMEFPENTETFMIIWPDDPISSYDLLELADLCLVPWSVMGQEAVRVGIPVLSFTGNMFYPDDDFIQIATTLEEYNKKLDTMLNMDYTWNHLIKAIRFYHWRTLIPSLDLGETVSLDCNDDEVWPDVPSKMENVVADILYGREDLLFHNIKQWYESLPSDAFFAETQAVKLGIRIFLDKIFYPVTEREKEKEKIIFRIKSYLWRKLTGKIIDIPEKPFADYSLEYSEDISRVKEYIQQTRRDNRKRILVADGMYATLIREGKLLKRMSPMVIRLARLHDSSAK